MSNSKIVLILFLSFLVACTPTRQLTTTALTDDGKIEVIFLQINDVYEIAPLEGGKVGGMARVASLRKQLLKENPNTLTILSGDFLNPSVIGTLTYQDEKIKGKQMIEAMNSCGVDLVTFGNHEFDLKEKDLQKRLNESKFQWISSNVLQQTEDGTQPFHRLDKEQKPEFFPETWTWSIKDADGTCITIGFFGVTLDSNPKDYVLYKDFKKEAVIAVSQLQQHSELVIGVTHLEIDQDLELAKLVQDVPLFMGGHDHHHMKHQVGNVTVAKADANARTAYVHRLTFDKKTKKTTLRSELVAIDDKFPADPVTDAIVNKWNNIATKTFKAKGFDPDEVILNLEEPLDGKESSIRHHQTNLGTAITKAMSATADNKNDCSLLNSGSIRIDDELAGGLTQYDMIRTMPFGGSLITLEMTGELLQKVLDEGAASKGKGAFLQMDKVSWQADKKQWIVNNAPLKADKNYEVIINNFLLKGLDIKSLSESSEGLLKVREPNKEDKTDIRNDIRIVVIDYLKKNG